MKGKLKSIRVLVVEDSLVCRELLVAILQGAPGIQVVGTARDGQEAVRLVKRLKPDVVTMDVYMPKMDGYEATRQIMAEMPLPIIIVSDQLNKTTQLRTFDALKNGALGICDKPMVDDSPEVHQQLISQVRLMSEVPVVRRWSQPSRNGSNKAVTSSPMTAPKRIRRVQRGKSKFQVLAIAASTGGPGALVNILSEFPEDYPIPILIVQHVTVGFGQGLATWLNSQTKLTVRVARHGDEPQPGQVLIAPDSHHMAINALGLIALDRSPLVNGLRPSADYLFHSIAQTYGRTAVGVILTGMGSDGAAGLLAMHQAGAYTIAQDEESCVVFGMPAVAIEMGAVDSIKPITKISSLLLEFVQE